VRRGGFVFDEEDAHQENRRRPSTPALPIMAAASIIAAAA
jgi:hypothetical protein